MKFKQHVDKLVKAQGVSVTAVLQQFESEAGISLLTLQHVYRGSHLSRYDKAKSLSEATGGQVTIKELCE